MSAERRQRLARIDELEVEHNRLTILADAFDLVRTYLKTSTAQSVAAAHGEVLEARTWTKQMINDERKKLTR